MENMNELNLEELEAVDGGASFNLNGDKLEIFLEPGESAVVELQKKLNSGIQVYGMTLTIEDPQNCLMNAASRLDCQDMINNARRCSVIFSMSGFTKVIVKAVEF